MTNQSAPSAAARDAATKPVHDACTLTNGGDTALIRLGSETYTLRITRSGKLILTK